MMGRKVYDAEGRLADLAVPPRGVTSNRGFDPPEGLRNWICSIDGVLIDGHSDPDRSGFCIFCGAVTDWDDPEYVRLEKPPREWFEPDQPSPADHSGAEDGGS